MGGYAIKDGMYVPLLIAGISAFTVALVISIYLHPSFDLFSPDQALSDLGRVGDPLGYIFNLGVIISGLLFMVASIANIPWAKGDTFKRSAAAVFIFALILYVMIGTFPKGTPYHNFFARSFFLISTIAIALWLASEVRKGSRIISAIVLSLVVLSYVFFFTYHAVGFAFAELFGGYTITAWLFLFRK